MTFSSLMILPIFSSILAIMAAYSGELCIVRNFESVSSLENGCLLIYSGSYLNGLIVSSPNFFAFFKIIDLFFLCPHRYVYLMERQIYKKGLSLWFLIIWIHSSVSLSVRYSPSGPSGNIGLLYGTK